MSYVTTIILTTPYSDCDPAVEAVNAWLVDEYDAAPLMNVRELWRSAHVMNARIYCGAYNKLDVTALVEKIRAAPWDGCLDEVRLLVQGDDFTAPMRVMLDRPFTGRYGDH